MYVLYLDIVIFNRGIPELSRFYSREDPDFNPGSLKFREPEHEKSVGLHSLIHICTLCSAANIYRIELKF